MRWQSDSLHTQHPPCTENIPSLYSVMGQAFLLRKTPEGPQLNLDEHVLFRFPVNISTLQHLLGNELKSLQEKRKKKKKLLPSVSSVTFSV